MIYDTHERIKVVSHAGVREKKEYCYDTLYIPGTGTMVPGTWYLWKMQMLHASCCSAWGGQWANGKATKLKHFS